MVAFPSSSFVVVKTLCTDIAHSSVKHLRDFCLPWVVWWGSCSACGLSYPQPPDRCPHGCTVGIDLDPLVLRLHPGRMMGTSEGQLLRAWFAWLCKWLLSHVYGGGLFTVNLVCSARTPLRPTPCEEGVGRPRRLHPSACTRYCTAVLSRPSRHSRLDLLFVATRRIGTVCSRNRATGSPLSGDAMQTLAGAVMVDATGHGFLTRADGVSGISPSSHAGSLVTVRSEKYGVPFASGFVCEGLHCDPILCACWHDGRKFTSW